MPEALPSPSRRWYVYALRDPISWDVRYIGKSGNPRRRLLGHLYDSYRHTHHTARWVQKLIRQGLRPFLEIIDAGRGSGENAAERAWIAEYRRRGVNITNATDGGEGVPRLSPEAVAKMVAAKRGQPRPQAAIEAQRKKMIGHPVSEETRKKIRLAITGQKRSDETRAEMSRTRKGRTHTPATKERMSFSHMGRGHSEDTRKRMSANATVQRAREKQEKEAAILVNPPPPKRPISGWKHTDEDRALMSEKAMARGPPAFVPYRPPGFHMSEESKQKLGTSISTTKTRKREEKALAETGTLPPKPPPVNATRSAAQQGRRAREVAAKTGGALAPPLPKHAPKTVPLDDYRARKAAEQRARRARLKAAATPSSPPPSSPPPSR